MRIVPLTCLLTVLLALAGCAATTSSGTSAGVSSKGSNGGPPTGFSSGGLSGGSSGSPSRQPVPAPSDSEGLRVSGPIAVSLLSRFGPLDPAGPYLGKDRTDLLGKYRGALNGRQPNCLPSGCWSDAKVPESSMLLAVRPATVACYQLTDINTARSADTIRIDLQLNYVCRPGVGTGARMAGWLFALPASELPASGQLTVRVSLRPGTAYTDLGSVAI